MSWAWSINCVPFCRCCLAWWISSVFLQSFSFRFPASAVVRFPLFAVHTWFSSIISANIFLHKTAFTNWQAANIRLNWRLYDKGINCSFTLRCESPSLSLLVTFSSISLSEQERVHLLGWALILGRLQLGSFVGHPVTINTDYSASLCRAPVYYFWMRLCHCQTHGAGAKENIASCEFSGEEGEKKMRVSKSCESKRHTGK